MERTRHSLLYALVGTLAGALASYCYFSKELERARQLRQSERNGRIAAEKGKRVQFRKEKEQQSTVSKLSMDVIGTVSSPFPDRRGTPR